MGWWESMICRGLQINFSEMLVDRNFRSVQHVIAKAAKFDVDAQEKIFLSWAALPRSLFGRHIKKGKESSIAIEDFLCEVEKVWFQIIPDFDLKLSRFNGILSAQIHFVNQLQLRMLACVFFLFGILV